MRSAAFTLIELLVVLGIIAVLAGIAIPSFLMISARGQSTACLSNLRQIGTGLQLYLQEHDMQMPVMLAGRRSRDEDGPVMDELLLPYLSDPKIFLCPADSGLGSASGSSYYWNVALNGQNLHTLNFIDIADTPSRIPVMSDKEGWHRYVENKVNFLYGDGHVTKDFQLFTGD